MKLLRSLPTERAFFDNYALLIKGIRKSKTAAQLVSALTEVGIIYAIAYKSIHPILPDIAVYVSILIAIIFTLVIEAGLRMVTPLSVDAFLYKRFNGLHLAMTIAVLTLTITLLATSGLLSFQNSHTLVDSTTPQVEEQTTTQVDSTLNTELKDLTNSYSTDSLQLAQSYDEQIASVQTTHKSQRAALIQRLQNYISKERRSGKSYISRKERIQQDIADNEATEQKAIAELNNTKQSKLRKLHNGQIATKDSLQKEHKTAVLMIKDGNSKAQTDRNDQVASYGGRLGYFTLVCLFIFVVANILERIHHKGSGITEVVDISQYDVSPHWIINGLDAMNERISYFFQSRIKSYADTTPAAPLPEQKAALYDPTEIANIAVSLEISPAEDDEQGNIVYIYPKYRDDSFYKADKNNTRETPTDNLLGDTAQEDSCAIKDTPKTAFETPDLRSLKQRLKMYKKRLGGHIQKKLAAERRGEEVGKRTLAAIENNQRWVEHYIKLIDASVNAKPMAK